MTQKAPMSIAKMVLIVVGVAVVTSVAVTLGQVWLTGKSSGAIAGGVSGAIVMSVAIHLQRQRQAANQQQPKS